MCLGTALIAWSTPIRWWAGKGFDYADGAGLAAYAVLGSAKALASALTVGGMLLAPHLGLADAAAWSLAFASGFALRAAAIRWEWGLPSYGGAAEDSQPA